MNRPARASGDGDCAATFACPLAADPNRLLDMMQVLTKLTTNLDGVVARLNKGGEEFQDIDLRLRKIELAQVEMNLKITALEAARAEVATAVDFAKSAKASWKTITVIATVTCTLVEVVSWVIAHFTKH